MTGDPARSSHGRLLQACIACRSEQAGDDRWRPDSRTQQQGRPHDAAAGGIRASELALDGFRTRGKQLADGACLFSEGVGAAKESQVSDAWLCRALVALPPRASSLDEDAVIHVIACNIAMRGALGSLPALPPRAGGFQAQRGPFPRCQDALAGGAAAAKGHEQPDHDRSGPQHAHHEGRSAPLGAPVSASKQSMAATTKRMTSAGMPLLAPCIAEFAATPRWMSRSSAGVSSDMRYSSRGAVTIGRGHFHMEHAA